LKKEVGMSFPADEESDTLLRRRGAEAVNSEGAACRPSIIYDIAIAVVAVPCYAARGK
jgi:hypothetical protein